MTWHITKLQEDYSAQAWQMFERLPSFMKKVTGFLSSDYQEFQKSFNVGHNFGGFENEDLQVVVHGEVKNLHTVEGHLFCVKHADTALIQATILHGVTNVLKDYREIFIETPSRHKTLRNILNRIGFIDTGVSVYRQTKIETSIYLIK